MKTPYGRTFKLLTDIPNVECWNQTTGELHTLPQGTLLKLDHVHDSTSTTCCAMNEDGEARELFPNCYRFIVNNQVLGIAIGARMPKKTQDLVGDIIAYEAGQATKAQTKRLFKNPICRKLQGHYSSRCTA